MTEYDETAEAQADKLKELRILVHLTTRCTAGSRRYGSSSS